MGINLNPFHYISEGFDWTTSEVTSITEWTTSEVGKAAGWTVNQVKRVGPDVANYVEQGIHGVLHVVTGLVDEIHHEITLVNRDLATVGHWAAVSVRFVENAESWVGRKLDAVTKAIEHDVVEPVAHEIHVALHDVERASAGAFHSVVSELSRIERSTLAPIAHWIENAPSEIANEFTNEWHSIYHDVISPLETDARWIESEAAGAVDWVTKYGPGLLDVVTKAADWLILMGEYSITGIEDLAQLATSQTKIGDLVAASKQDTGLFTDLESVVASLFD